MVDPFTIIAGVGLGLDILGGIGQARATSDIAALDKQASNELFEETKRVTEADIETATRLRDASRRARRLQQFRFRREQGRVARAARARTAAASAGLGGGNVTTSTARGSSGAAISTAAANVQAANVTAGFQQFGESERFRQQLRGARSNITQARIQRDFAIRRSRAQAGASPFSVIGDVVGGIGDAVGGLVDDITDIF